MPGFAHIVFNAGGVAADVECYFLARCRHDVLWNNLTPSHIVPIWTIYAADRQVREPHWLDVKV
jgi:hypothetical protein